MFSYQIRPPEQESAYEKAPHRSILLYFNKNCHVTMATSSNICTTEQAVPLPICPPLDVRFMADLSCDYRL